MLDKLLKHNSLGSKEEILFVLFRAISSSKEQLIDDLKLFCISHKYNISKSFNGIVSLLNYVEFIEVKKNKIKLQETIFKTKDYQKREIYFRNEHFYIHLFTKLISNNYLHKLFTAKNVQFDSDNNAYFIKCNLIPIKSFTLKNLLVAVGFFNIDKKNNNHLIINQVHHKVFEELIVPEIKRKNKTKRQISLKRLKAIQKAQEKAGMKAELFVYKYEKERLKKHSFRQMIEIISSKFANAGYDIESFTGFNSIVPNRFIEVKSFNENTVFYWSKNETNTAIELGNNYFLYLVDRSKYHLIDYKPMIIRNPYKRIFKNEIWKIEIENWKISLEK
jgi:hypothetical protein